MDITPQVPKGVALLTGYGGGGFYINQQFVEGSLLLTPAGPLPWPHPAEREISLEALVLLESWWAELDVLILGTGETLKAPSPVLKAHCRALGVTVDGMDTGAACRTYHVLLSEGRRVAAALIAV